MQLIVKFRIHGDTEWRVRGAARISLARGRLTLVEHQTLASETIALSRIKALSIQYVHADRPTAVAV